MDWRIVVLAVSLLIIAVPAPSLGQSTPEDSFEYEIVIDCPWRQGGLSVDTCPGRAVDADDAMGDPAIAVDPDNPANMIIASLHNTGDYQDAPTPKSRCCIQPFTTFVSQNHGAGWNDNPYVEPPGVGQGFGEHPAITIDPYGHVFIGSLYAVPGQPEGRFDYVVAAQKFRGIRDVDSNQDGSYNVEYLGSVYQGNRISQMWYVHNQITDNMTMVWNEQTTNFSSGGPRGAERASETLDEVLRGPVALTDRVDELAAAGTEPLAAQRYAAQEPDEPKSVIGVAWTKNDMRSGYEAAPGDRAIGPCSSSTNPVLGLEDLPDGERNVYESDIVGRNWLYIGCKVAGGEGPFPWNPDAEPGDLEMFRMHPDGGRPQYLGPAPLSDGEPKLGVRSDGRIALMTTDVADGEVRLEAAFGSYHNATGTVAWGPVQDFGPDVDPIEGTIEDRPVVETNIQDMIYREQSGVIHMVFKQVTLPGTSPIAPTVHKSIVAIDEKYGLLDQIDLDIGNPAVRVQDMTLMVQPDEVFNDISDDFLELPPESGYRYNDRPLGREYQREFFAVGDYGTVIFAEVIEITDLRGPGWAPTPPPPPPPVPAAAAASSQALATAAALTASAVLAGTVTTAKRKSVVRAGRKKR